MHHTIYIKQNKDEKKWKDKEDLFKRRGFQK